MIIKIVTVNVPESYIAAISKLVGENGLYPSRSELIRCAVRDFLLKELKMANNMIKYKEAEIDDFDENNFVRVPITSINERSEPVREFKTYKIIKNLDDIESFSEKTEPKERRGKSKQYPLGNPFWIDKIDEKGNLIRVPKN